MKRAQAAMEFLMTYGWAILVVLVVIQVITLLEQTLAQRAMILTIM